MAREVGSMSVTFDSSIMGQINTYATSLRARMGIDHLDQEVLAKILLRVVCDFVELASDMYLSKVRAEQKLHAELSSTAVGDNGSSVDLAAGGASTGEVVTDRGGRDVVASAVPVQVTESVVLDGSGMDRSAGRPPDNGEADFPVESEQLPLAEAIISALKESSLTKSEATSRFGKTGNAVLEQLLDRGYVRLEKDEPTGMGRPPMRWSLV